MQPDVFLAVKSIFNFRNSKIQIIIIKRLNYSILNRSFTIRKLKPKGEFLIGKKT